MGKNRKRNREQADALPSSLNLIKDLAVQFQENPIEKQAFFQLFVETETGLINEDGLLSLTIHSGLLPEATEAPKDSQLRRHLHSILNMCHTNTKTKMHGASLSDFCWLLSVQGQQRRSANEDSAYDENTSTLLAFYKAHPLFQAMWEREGEWNLFLQTVRRPLPMSFRIHTNDSALNLISGFALKKEELSCVAAPAWLGKDVLAFECDHHTYHETCSGGTSVWCKTLHGGCCLSFQEEVSMIPVIALSITAEHRVLDMCAAPGSKSLQALDKTLENGWNCAENSVVLLNEKDRIKATQTLPARIKKYHAPNCVVTRCDATGWPQMYTHSGSELCSYYFDRIICDVPCSGDGTVRKERSVFSSWSPDYVEELVPIQKAICKRGLALLAEGGLMAYSTCSLNPLEDELVVLSALQCFGDEIELVDVNLVLQEKGANLASRGGVEIPADWVAGPIDKAMLELVQQRVLRVWPHRNNTGGFFVALFRRRQQFCQLVPQLKQLNNFMQHKRWRVAEKSDPIWVQIQAFYDFSDRDCPLVPVFQLNPHTFEAKRIVLATKAVSTLLSQCGLYKGPGVELVSLGVRAFELYSGTFLDDAPCRWRCVVESASFLASICRRRKILLTSERHILLIREIVSSGSLDFDVVLKAGLLTSENVYCDEVAQPGGVFLGFFCCDVQTPLWLTASLSSRKLEIAADISLRVLLFRLFFNEELPQ